MASLTSTFCPSSRSVPVDKVAEHHLNNDAMHVSFGENIKTWAEGVAYGRVATDCKGEEGLDLDPEQWHRQSGPTP